MNQKKNRSVLQQATIAVFGMLAAAMLFLSSFRTQKMTDDMWKMLGISKQSADENIQNSFMYGYLYYYGVKNAKNLAVNDRGAIAKDLLGYTKNFVNSPSFKKQYDEMRKNSKPQAPEVKPLRSIEEIQKEEIAKTEKSIKDSEKTIKELPQLAEGIRPVLEMLKKNLKEYQDPKNKLFAAIAQGEKYDQESRQRSYEDNMKQWEKSMPENINDFIADRLQKMLDRTKGIDYNAELVEKYGKKRFANPAYEGKNQEWKQGYRAGKDVTETARAFAQKWLDEIKSK